VKRERRLRKTAPEQQKQLQNQVRNSCQVDEAIERQLATGHLKIATREEVKREGKRSRECWTHLLPLCLRMRFEVPLVVKVTDDGSC
jgi:hypothetical protein